MLEVGWEAIRLQAWPVGVKRSQSGGPGLQGMYLYRVPAGWEDDA
jgi:hypothetical protein